MIVGDGIKRLTVSHSKVHPTAHSEISLGCTADFRSEDPREQDETQSLDPTINSLVITNDYNSSCRPGRIDHTLHAPISPGDT